MNLYSVYDSTAQEFTPPFQSKNNLTALRMVDGFAPYPGFELFFVGKFSTESGILTPETLQKVGDIKVKEKKDDAV